MSSKSWAHKDPFFQPIGYDYEVWESDFSEFVSNFYNKPYNYQQWCACGEGSYEHASNGASFDLEVLESKEIWGYAEKELNEWLDTYYIPEDWKYEWEFPREHGLDPEIIMWDLHRKGIVPAGKYLFKVWW